MPLIEDIRKRGIEFNFAYLETLSSSSSSCARGELGQWFSLPKMD